MSEANSMTDLPIQNQSLAKSDRLTARQETFARLYVECGLARDAYIAAYACDGSSRATIRVASSRLLHNPKVAARIRELQEAAGARSTRSTQALLGELEEMACADANELMTLLNGACRHCWGDGHRYQWRHAEEYADAVEAAQGKGVALPACDGGFGFDFHRGPNPECPACDGVGVNRVQFNGMADASPGARRLLRGIELFPDGSLKRVLLHDQMQARMELHRLRGLHVERSLNVNVNTNLPAFEKMTREEQHEFLASLAPPK